MNQGMGQAPYGQPQANQYNGQYSGIRPFAPAQPSSPAMASGSSGYGFQGMASNPQQAYGVPGPQAGMNSLAGYRQADRPALSWLQRLFHNPRKLATVGGVGAAAILVMVGVTALTGGVGQTPSASTFGIFGGGAKNPDELFQTALTNALQTKNFTQKVTDDNRTIERSVDVGIVASPRITGKASIKDTATSFEAYANRDNTFVKLTKSPSLSARPALAGTWVQVRKDATLLDNSGTGGTSMDVLFTPMTALFGSFIFGNYQPADRDALLSIINDQIVYRYDPSSVVQASVDGQAVSQFKVTVSASGQQALAAKAQQIAGIDQVRISQAATIARLSGSSNSHLIVSVSNNEQRIVQVATDADKNVETVHYGGMDITQVMDRAPQPQAVWDDYARQLAGR